jgi:tripartite-type tricarboxylate transporter receptor subunit TctC
MVGRVIGDILAKQLGTTVVIENVPGAAGVVGAQRVVSSKPDGYTLLAGSSNEMAGTKFVNAAQKYDPAVDLTPIALTASAPNLWVAGAHVPVKNMDEFIKLVKANPGKYSYGSPGIGSTPHFSGELIKKTAGVHLVHIPYKGSPAMTGDLGGGNLDFAILSPMASAPLVQSGKIKILGATTAERISSLKNVPALAEHPALKGYALSGWSLLWQPPRACLQISSPACKSGAGRPGRSRHTPTTGSRRHAACHWHGKPCPGHPHRYGQIRRTGEVRQYHAG